MEREGRKIGLLSTKCQNKEEKVVRYNLVNIYQELLISIVVALNDENKFLLFYNTCNICYLSFNSIYLTLH